MPTSADLPELLALKARCVFPVAGEPIRDGIVTIQGERIVAVGGRTPAGEVRDLGNVAVLPGLVNAHTHLEFSGLSDPLGRPGVPLTEWIGEILAFRRQPASQPEHAVKDGLAECVCCGTTTLAEIARPGWEPSLFQAGTPDTTVFLELIALRSDRIAGELEAAREHLRSAAGSSGWRPGLSPHAPYSVHPVLLDGLVSLSASGRVPLAMHLAESAEEVELLRSGTGPFREMLQRMDSWDSAAFAPGTRPIVYLRTLSAAHRALVIHGNYLDDEEIAFLARHARRMAVVYCPRTHAYFGHPPYPLEKLLAAGATVALGTDSRASSPDLSLLAEMRRVARKHRSLPPATVLKLGTLFGARALGRDHELGSLEPGKRADLAVVAIPDRAAADPHQLLLDSDQPVIAAWHKGRPIDQ